MLLYEKIPIRYLGCSGQGVTNPSLITIDPRLCAPGVLLPLSKGMDGSGSLLGSAHPLQTLTSSGAEFQVQPGRESVKLTFNVKGILPQSKVYPYIQSPEEELQVLVSFVSKQVICTQTHAILSKVVTLTANMFIYRTLLHFYTTLLTILH